MHKYKSYIVTSETAVVNRNCLFMKVTIVRDVTPCNLVYEFVKVQQEYAACNSVLCPPLMMIADDSPAQRKL